jgi:SAM-dependent methyltransferase
MEGHNDRASFPVDYDAYAPTYAWARRAVPWVLQPLVRLAAVLPAKASVLEIGCGTGNYISALSDTRGDLAYCAFDLSEAMLSEARSRGSSVVFLRGDASEVFPFPDQTFAFAFAVDVIHHIDDLSRFFAEAHRVLVPGGRLAIVTDSESTLKRRSLTCFFPEILPIELARYPSVSLLHKQANRAGLQLFSEEEVMGKIALDGEFLARLEAKCSSAMRLMDPEAHAAGMERVRAAGKRGQQWFSYYDVLVYARSTMKEQSNPRLHPTVADSESAPRPRVSRSR